MARQPRRVLADGFFHVTSRGTAATQIFLDDADRLTFVELLSKTIDRCSWTCHAYCLMTTHYHLVVEALLADLSRGMHRLNGIYAQRFNKRYDRIGHLFQGRYDARLIDSEEHLRAACQYVADNPVRARLCHRAEDWRWSFVADAEGL
jgi:putative transposase